MTCKYNLELRASEETPRNDYTFSFFLLLSVALCATQASAATLGEAVAGLCGPILDGLQLPGFSSLKAALDAGSDIDVGGAI